MRRFLAPAIVLVAVFGAAQAERRIAPVRPYSAIEVTLPPPLSDGTFDAFRAELAKVAQGRVYADLARLTAAHDFFWARDFTNRFDPRKPGVDNLAAALRLEHDAGAGWTELERLAGESRASPLESRLGVFCAPGAPQFDAIALDRLIETTRTDAADWSYTAAPDAAVRAAPRSDAAAIEMLGSQFVRVLDAGGADGWIKVGTPGGATGFLAPGTLRRLHAPRLCYAKAATGRWQIAGFISGGD